jgi:hypothetical protein
MWRKLANVSSAVSLTLAVAVAVLWLRSYWRADSVYRQATPIAWSIASNHGGITIGRRAYDGLSLSDATWRHFSHDAHAIGYGVPVWRFAGFARGSLSSSVGTGELAYRFRDEYWTFPHWFVACLLLILPILSATRIRSASCRRQRIARGECAHCGYDLRASPERCPECGATCDVKNAR